MTNNITTYKPLLVSILSIILATSCTRPCKDIQCQNGGLCDDIGGQVSCICQTGYYGDQCELKWVDNITGHYEGSQLCDINNASPSPSTLPETGIISTISEIGLLRASIENFGNTGLDIQIDITGTNRFIINPIPPLDSIEISGSAQIEADTITINYELFDQHVNADTIRQDCILRYIRLQ